MVAGASLADLLDGLDDLVGSDPAAAVERTRLLQRRAEELGSARAAAAALVWRADAEQRRGDAAGAAALVTRARESGQLTGEALVRACWVLSRVFTDLGDRPTALEHGLDAVAASDERVPRRLRTRVLIKVADLLDELGAADDARSWYARAEDLAAGDAQLHLLVVNNRAYSALEAGDAAAAERECRLMQELSEQYQRPLNASALDTVARVHLLAGDPERAVRVAQEAVDAAAHMDAKLHDDLPEYLLTLAAAQRHLGEPLTAAGTLQRARDACGTDGWGGFRARTLAEEAEVLAALGDYRGAFEAHKAFHAADKETLSAQREAQARARQALFETEVAREEAARYREQARRDPLTGLRNRLFVDERLPALLGRFRSGPRTLATALVDLDHFKAVNDTYSHEVGDEVLRVVAGLLEEALALVPGEESFAARLGGEEFLLVLCTGDLPAALAVVEGLRRAVEEHDWSAITPGRGVTLSAGVAAASVDSTRTSLLARADARLYEAKAAGRNRVVGGGGGAADEAAGPRPTA